MTWRKPFSLSERKYMESKWKGSWVEFQLFKWIEKLNALTQSHFHKRVDCHMARKGGGRLKFTPGILIIFTLTFELSQCHIMILVKGSCKISPKLPPYCSIFFLATILVYIFGPPSHPLNERDRPPQGHLASINMIFRCTKWMPC